MHTVELLEESLVLAKSLGYQLRQEWLGGSGGGGCELKGQKWIFIDLTLPPDEQLELVLDTLRREESVDSCKMSVDLAQLLKQ